MGVHRDPDSDSEEGFASRWSRRKQAVRLEGKHEGDAPVSPAPPEDAAEAKTVVPLTDADMPPLESLDERSDYAAFMSEGVSEQLRAHALRKLFRLPGMHLPDGLDDYDDDFTQFTKLGETLTHEMKRMLNRQAKSADTPADSEPPQDVRSADNSDVQADGSANEDEPPTEAGAADTAAGQDDEAQTRGNV